MLRIVSLTSFLIICFTGLINGQAIDTSMVVTSAIARVTFMSNNAWTADQLCRVLQQNSTVKMIELESEGFRGLLFFRLDFPEGGIEFDREENITMTFDPSLTQPGFFFAYDLISNDLYLVNQDFNDDTLELFYLVQHRLDSFYGDIYKKRSWVTNLSIEGVSMSWLWKKATRLL